MYSHSTYRAEPRYEQELVDQGGADAAWAAGSCLPLSIAPPPGSHRAWTVPGAAPALPLRGRHAPPLPALPHPT